MKFNSIKLISLSVIFLSGSCEKEDPTLEGGCNLTGQNILNVSNEKGVLVYTDSISGIRVADADFYINANNIDDVTVPLQVCNIPKERFSIQQGDSIPITFSGKIELGPNSSDVLSLVVELSAIESTSD